MYENNLEIENELPKIELTRQQYRTLMTLLEIGNHVAVIGLDLNGTTKSDSQYIRIFEDFTKFMYSFSDKFNCSDIYDKECETHSEAFYDYCHDNFSDKYDQMIIDECEFGKDKKNDWTLNIVS